VCVSLPLTCPTFSVLRLLCCSCCIACLLSFFVSADGVKTAELTQQSSVDFVNRDPRRMISCKGFVQPVGSDQSEYRTGPHIAASIGPSGTYRPAAPARRIVWDGNRRFQSLACVRLLETDRIVAPLLGTSLTGTMRMRLYACTPISSRGLQPKPFRAQTPRSLPLRLSRMRNLPCDVSQNPRFLSSAVEQIRILDSAHERALECLPTQIDFDMVTHDLSTRTLGLCHSVALFAQN